MKGAKKEHKLKSITLFGELIEFLIEYNEDVNKKKRSTTVHWYIVARTTM